MKIDLNYNAMSLRRVLLYLCLFIGVTIFVSFHLIKTDNIAVMIFFNVVVFLNIMILLHFYRKALKYASRVEINDSDLIATFSNGKKINVNLDNMEVVKIKDRRNVIDYKIISIDRTKEIFLRVRDDSDFLWTLLKKGSERKDEHRK